MARKKKIVRHHSAITGKFVTPEYAEANKATTVAITTCNLHDEIKAAFKAFGFEVTDQEIAEYLKHEQRSKETTA